MGTEEGNCREGEGTALSGIDGDDLAATSANQKDPV